jgi:hypothetical protein
MVLAGVRLLNEKMDEIESEHRFSEAIPLDSRDEEHYGVYMAKKKSGKPKDDYPSKTKAPLKPYLIFSFRQRC